MDHKGHIIDQKGLKMYEKRQKMEFSLAELGGTPLSPLAENHPAQKPLAERGGTPIPPLLEKSAK